jgi:hypothetical protein
VSLGNVICFVVYYYSIGTVMDTDPVFVGFCGWYVVKYALLNILLARQYLQVKSNFPITQLI